MAKQSSFLYAVLRPWVIVGARLFFRKIEIVGAHKLQRNKPFIIIANHQNAMMDPVLCCLFFEKQLHWLTRADVFRNAMVKRLLYALNMLPVYRERDKVDDMAGKNDQIFRDCQVLLAEKKVIALFPEGMHRGKKQLNLPLKKGLARLAFRTIEANEITDDLMILPVGIDYENFFDYRSYLLVKTGEPFSANAYFAMYAGDRPRAMTALMSRASEALSACMIDIKNNSLYHCLMHLRSLSDAYYKKRRLYRQFLFFKKMTDRVSQYPEKYDAFLAQAQSFFLLSKKIKLDGSLGAEDVSLNRMFGTFLWVLLGIPFAIIAGIGWGIIYFIAENVVRKKVKDPLFKNSIRLVFWVFLTPIWLIGIILFLLILQIPAFHVMLILGAIIFSGWISLKWWSAFQLLKKMWRIEKLKSAFDHDFMQWNRYRKDLIKQMIDINK